MFGTARGVTGAAADAAAAAPLDAAAITAAIARLAHLDTDVSDAERIDQLRALERVKAAAAAAQARVAADLDVSQRADQAAAGVPAHQLGRGIGAQIALARRDSPARGGRHLGLALALVHEMPHTLTALEQGIISEWRATLLVRETACLSREHRHEIDRRIAGDPATLQRLGDRRLVAEIRRLACQLDIDAVLRRRRYAEAERRVTCRPAPDSMALLNGLVPMAQGVAMYAALCRAADAAIARGDARSRGQIMADTLVERVTGQTTAAATPVEIQLVISSATLLGASDEPAHLRGHGPVPAPLARQLAAHTAHAEIAWLRRLFTTPDTGELVAMESRRRRFPPGLARFIRTRDDVCRTPWCEAPIRHIDHVIPHQHGGPTTADNGQGLCELCNHARQAPGWSTRRRNGPRHTLGITTPTGHHYQSTPPRPPGTGPPRHPRQRSGAHPRAAVPRGRDPA